MEERTYDEGFLLPDLCVVLLAVSLLMTFILPLMRFPDMDYYAFPDEYLYIQSQALASAESSQLHTDMINMHFNAFGNIRNPCTLYFSNQNKRIVIELGGGRLVFKK